MGLPSYLWALAFHRERRREMLRTMLASLRELVAVAILLDIISQFLIFREIHPGAAILLGPGLIGVPYALSRALSGRICEKQKFPSSVDARSLRHARSDGACSQRLLTNWISGIRVIFAAQSRD